MARSFNGSTQYLSRSGAVATRPLSMACWFKTNNVTATVTLMSLGNNGASGFFGLQFAGSVANDPIRAVEQSDGGANNIATINTTVATGTWYHAGGTFADGQRFAFWNGTAGSAQNGGVASTVTPDFSAVGALRVNSVSQITNGSIAHAAFWNGILLAADMAALAAGVSPLLIKPHLLAAYYPLYNRQDDEEDWIGGATLTATATPGFSDEPRILYPRQRRQFFPATAAASAVFNPLSGRGGAAAQPLAVH